MTIKIAMAKIRSLARREVLIGLLNFAWIAPLAATLLEMVRFFRYEPPTTQQTRFAIGSSSALPDLPAFIEGAQVWLHRDGNGLYAIDAICTHLGCTITLETDGSYECPCHGSRFAPDGTVLRGPASIPLRYLALAWSAEGQLIVDRSVQVDPPTRLASG